MSRPRSGLYRNDVLYPDDPVAGGDGTVTAPEGPAASGASPNSPEMQRAGVGPAPAATTQADSSTLISALKNLAADPQRAAAAIRNGEFSKTGTGDLGTAFRMLARLEGENLVEGWAALIDMTGALWEAGHMQESVDLTEQARLRLTVPAVFKERIDTSIQTARDQIILARVEARFREGDDERARSLLAQVKSPDGRRS